MGKELLLYLSIKVNEVFSFPKTIFPGAVSGKKEEL